MEPKIDLDKYRGLTAEEARRRMAEDERRAIYEDPRYKAVVEQGKRERAAREAEAEQRRQHKEAQREAEARARLEEEKARQRRLWISCGNPASEFEAAWPQIKREILMERRRARLSEIDSGI